jgi:hypothetical protein
VTSALLSRYGLGTASERSRVNLVERYRGYVVDHGLTRSSFEPSWPTRREILKDGLATPPASARHVVDVGDRMAAAQRMTTIAGAAAGGRGQSSVTVAGTSWMVLVAYYLNLVYAGTEAVAVSRATAPQSIKNAMKVSYGGASVEGDLDVALIVLPDASRRGEPLVGGSDIAKRNAARDEYRQLFDAGFNNAYVCLIACKTNWNDSVQSAMLWNLLYSLRAAGGALPGGLSIGSGGYSLDRLAGFTNALVTVPSNNPAGFTTTGMPVQRARTMTGGYYWGYPRKAHVVENIKGLLDVQASKSPLIPPASSAGAGFLAELTTMTGDIDLPAFRWT